MTPLSDVPLPPLLRDPNLMETLDIYDGSAGFLRELELGGDELTKVSPGRTFRTAQVSRSGRGMSNAVVAGMGTN